MTEPMVPVTGFRLQTDTITVSPAHQADKLGACGIDPQVFGADVDPSFFIGIAINAGIKSGISAEGKEAELNYKLGTQLPYMMIINRLAHYIQVIQRENIGTWKDRATDWLRRRI